VVYQFLGEPLHLYKDISIPPGSYKFVAHQVAYTSSGNHRLTFTASEQWGSYYTGSLNTAKMTAQYRPNPHLALE
jgi:hypothetical protein